jgi:hypothetical protein
MMWETFLTSDVPDERDERTAEERRTGVAAEYVLMSRVFVHVCSRSQHTPVIQKERERKKNVTKKELRQAEKTCEPGVSRTRERFGEDVGNHLMTGNPLKGGVRAARARVISIPKIHFSSPRSTISKADERSLMMHCSSRGVEAATAISSV